MPSSSPEAAGAPAAGPAGKGAQLFRRATLGGSVRRYVGWTIVHRAIGLVRLWVLLWLLGETVMGRYQLGLLLIVLLTPFTVLGLGHALDRYVPMFEARGQLRQLLRRAFASAMVLASGGFAIGLALTGLLGPLLFASGVAAEQTPAALAHQLWICCMVNVFLTALYSTLYTTWRGLRAFGAVAAMEVSHGLVFSVTAVLAVIYYGSSAPAVLICYGVCMAAVVAIFAGLLVIDVRRGPADTSRLDAHGLIWRLLSYSGWHLLAEGGMRLLPIVTVWWLNRTQGPAQAGVLAAILSLGQVVGLLGHTLTSVAYPHVTRLWEAGQQQMAKTTLTLVLKLLTAGLLGLAGAVVVTMPIWGQALPPGFRTGLSSFPFVLVYYLCLTQYSVLAIAPNVLQRPWAATISVGVALLVLFGAVQWHGGLDARGLALALGIATGSAALTMHAFVAAFSTRLLVTGLACVAAVGLLLGSGWLALLIVVAALLLAPRAEPLANAAERQMTVRFVRESLSGLPATKRSPN